LAAITAEKGTLNWYFILYQKKREENVIHLKDLKSHIAGLWLIIFLLYPALSGQHTNRYRQRMFFLLFICWICLNALYHGKLLDLELF